MALTDIQIRKAKPGDQTIKLPDGGGLNLFILPTGTKVWRLRYRIDGKEKLLTIGQYPEISLAEARGAREAQKQILREGRDPAEEKKRGTKVAATAQEVTFEHIAREWHEMNKSHWAEHHASNVLASLEREIFPTLGQRDIRTITVPETLAVLRAVEDRGALDLTKRMRQRMSAVFVHAIASGVGESDPAAIVEKALRPAVKSRQPAITDLKLAREILQRVDETPGQPATKLAMRLLALTALRPGTLINTPWSELDGLDEVEPIWRVPAARMKMRHALKGDPNRDHMVPLSKQAVEAIRVLRLITGRCPFILPNGRNAHKPASENALGYMLNRAGYHHRHVPHGWRATFSSIMNEHYPADRQVIDLMLAHTTTNKVEGAYNRAEHLRRRIELAQIWADMIMEGQRPPTDLLSGPRHASRMSPA